MYMNRQRQEYESSRERTNGLAYDTEASASRQESGGLTQSEVQGFLTLGGGILLLIAPWAFPTLLNIAVAATALVLIFFGSRRAHLVSKIRDFIRRWQRS
jgi:hypothetical protein